MVHIHPLSQAGQQLGRVVRQDGIVFQHQSRFVAVCNLLPNLVVAHEAGHFGDFDRTFPRKGMGLKKRIGNIGRSLRIDELSLQAQAQGLLRLKLPAFQR